MTHDTNEVVNWKEIEQKLKLTYPVQRKEINLQSFSTKDLLERWPFLFKEEGLLLHFKLLTGIDTLEVLSKFLEEKGKQISLYFKSQSETESVLETSINGIIAKFKEDKDDLLFFTDSMSIVKEVEKVNKKETPIIAVLGSTISEAKEFMILVDRIVVCSTSNFDRAFLCFFSLFYILNIKYPVSLEGTLEFFQRCMMGLNPRSGSKSKKQRKSCVNSKVLKVIAEISSYDWMTSSSQDSEN